MQHRAALCAARSSTGPKLLGARRLYRRFAAASENPPAATSSNAKVLELVAAGFSRAAVAVAVAVVFAVACRIAFSCHSDRGAAALAAPTRDLSSISALVAHHSSSAASGLHRKLASSKTTLTRCADASSNASPKPLSSPINRARNAVKSTLPFTSSRV